ncbi:DEAD/DEAH box helicase [Bacteroidia bacterium]|nr:DEAD/DEAH box helicase [Bacteroidia bacterium]
MSNMNTFNENSRVKIPAILYLIRLGYQYLSLSQSVWDKSTNIFTDIFNESLKRLNPDITERGLNDAFMDVSMALDNEDLGKRFYEMLTSPTPRIKYIDFENFQNNSFHVVTELSCIKDNEEFRPDITLLINGMPLAFIEVKKPNNRDGILAERERMKKRFRNTKFRRFINMSQFLVFSNNMEYDRNDTVEPLQGAYYAASSYQEAKFNFFREEDDYAGFPLDDLNENDVHFVLKDTNNVVIKSSPEFAENLNGTSPTNRVLTSLFSKSRLRDFLLYGIAYVHTSIGWEKHIMRYPQFFATKAIERTLESGIKKGIIWHTQGSGKTALAYYNVRYLIDYYKKKNIVPKFYFVVDRIDLAEQATSEFENRGLTVKQVQSKEGFKDSIAQQAVLDNDSGKPEMTVVNIQKFKDDSHATRSNNYNLNVQRIFFLDEVHRSYNPTGSFLANLLNADKEAVFIGLTGTPLIRNDRKSRDIFGDYIHKYYYNSSIADGYTLRLIREEIETTYKAKLKKTLENIQVLQRDIKREQVYAHKNFVEPMLDYIIEDLLKSRTRLGDDTIGAMVVCDSSAQARMMYECCLNRDTSASLSTGFNKIKEINKIGDQYEYSLAAEPKTSMKLADTFSAALILHDEGTKDDRKAKTTNFKHGTVDILFVYNMLLTGFDAHRLKKLYLGRVIKDHNLLQTLTRVNRPYKKHKYGYVVDFADISKEFDKTNRAYFDELQNELGDDLQYYDNLFKKPEEIAAEINSIKEILWQYNTDNAEIFSKQISEISDRKIILELKNALQSARELYNIIRVQGDFDLLDAVKFDFQKVNALLNETENHLALLNQKEQLENATDTTNLLNVAMEDIIFMFRKIKEDELVLAGKLKDILRITREEFQHNFDPKDPEFVSLYEALRKVFDKKNLDEITQEVMNENIDSLNRIYEQIQELNRRNRLLQEKYTNDKKYARIHKRLKERELKDRGDVLINEILLEVKRDVDDIVLRKNDILNNESYFKGELNKIIYNRFSRLNPNLDYTAIVNISKCISEEYINEFYGNAA